MSEWQPIKTAPREKTPILLSRVGGPVMSGRWYDDNVAGFYSDNIGPDEYTPSKPATHWRPLPLPPVSLGRAEPAASSSSPLGGAAVAHLGEPT